jgi:hypothetical protein
VTPPTILDTGASLPCAISRAKGIRVGFPCIWSLRGKWSGFGTIGGLQSVIKRIADEARLSRTVVKAMVSGHPSGAQRGHQTMRGCIAEWQEHCVLGVHPHPVEPQHAAGAIRSISGPPKAQGRRVDPELQAQL